MSECIFCAIARGDLGTELVASSPTAVAFRDIEPQAPVHVVVVPREHHRSLAELAEVDAQGAADLFTLAGEVARAEGVAGTGYRLVSNLGADSGQQVDHVHVHVLGGVALGALGPAPTAP